MSEINTTQLLSQIRAMKVAAQGGAAMEQTGGQAAQQVEFSSMLKGAIDKVNETQKSAGALKTAFEMGDPNVTLPQAMIATQKAGISFQAMTQVRNKLVSAYQDVMNMPV
ncbi:MAG: flagellar hook-basal body complex protein FliE [Gammaproteobacteria bacterium]|nr:flagellar hook-basal body complex protein FliE [Gammaproteobacteria bacterium]